MSQKVQKLKSHVRQGDMVKIITGDAKGKIGKVSKVFSKKNQIIIEGINLKTKHQKPRQEGEIGSIVKKEAPIHVSNVMLYSEQSQTASRTGYRSDENGKKIRYLVKNKEIIN